MIRVIVVDDQSLHREDLTRRLAASARVVVIGEATNGAEAIALCAQHRPDVVLMDLRMPVLDGAATTRRLVAYDPSVKVLALTDDDDDDDDERIVATLRAGAVGSVRKNVTAERLREAIEAAATDSATIAHRERRRVPARPDATALHELLTAREREVLRRLGRGASNKTIAAELSISEGTVKNHVTAILQKLEVSDRTQAALRARDLGLA